MILTPHEGGVSELSARRDLQLSVTGNRVSMVLTNCRNNMLAFLLDLLIRGLRNPTAVSTCDSADSRKPYCIPRAGHQTCLNNRISSSLLLAQMLN
jgi:hypothetical protein